MVINYNLDRRSLLIFGLALLASTFVLVWYFAQNSPDNTEDGLMSERSLLLGIISHQKQDEDILQRNYLEGNALLIEATKSGKGADVVSRERQLEDLRDRLVNATISLRKTQTLLDRNAALVQRYDEETNRREQQRLLVGVGFAIVGVLLALGAFLLLRPGARRGSLNSAEQAVKASIGDLSSGGSKNTLAVKQRIAELEKNREKLAHYRAKQPFERQIFDKFLDRMEEEKDRIKSASRANLLFGLSFSIVALIILGIPLVTEVLEPTKGVDHDWYSYVVQRSIPRFSIGFLIQVVGFFFLRLYVTNEMDLKHTKNEITNFEAWMMAATIADKSQNAELLEISIRALSEKERNFIVKRGEKTINKESDSRYNDLVGIVEESLRRLYLGRGDEQKGLTFGA